MANGLGDEGLPKELVGLMMRDLSPRDISSLSMTCKSLNKAVNADINKQIKNEKEREHKEMAARLQHWTAVMKKCETLAKKIKSETNQSKKLILALSETNPAYARSLLPMFKDATFEDAWVYDMQKEVRKNAGAYHPGLVKAAEQFKKARHDLKVALEIK